MCKDVVERDKIMLTREWKALCVTIIDHDKCYAFSIAQQSKSVKN